MTVAGPEDASSRYANLSPARRALLARWKRGEMAGLPPAPDAPAASDEAAFPLSFAQQRLWFLDQLAPHSAAYNVPIATRLLGPLDVEALGRSLNAIVQRHGIFRTTYAVRDDQPSQMVSPRLALNVPLVDLRGLPDSEIEVERVVSEESQRPFDLSRGPLLRALVLRLAETEHALLITMHHITTDDWSYGVFVRELAALYEAFSAGRPPDLPELPMQYADFAVWQRRWLLDEGHLDEQLAYWRKQLANLPTLKLPIDRPRPAVQTFRGDSLPIAFPAELSRAILTLAAREEVTPSVMLLSAFTVLLQGYSGQTDIVVGAPIANRRRAEVEGLIGFFANTLVLRTDLSGDPTFRELLGRVRQATLDAYAHQDVPFERLVEELQSERDASRNPLFQVLFDVQSRPAPMLSLPGIQLIPLKRRTGAAKFDLNVYLAQGGDRLGGTLEYNTDLFDASTIQRMAAHFQVILECATMDANVRLGEMTGKIRNR